MTVAKSDRILNNEGSNFGNPRRNATSGREMKGAPLTIHPIHIL
jgi:hypothetical protein